MFVFKVGTYLPVYVSYLYNVHSTMYITRVYRTLTYYRMYLLGLECRMLRRFATMKYILRGKLGCTNYHYGTSELCETIKEITSNLSFGTTLTSLGCLLKY